MNFMVPSQLQGESNGSSESSSIGYSDRQTQQEWIFVESEFFQGFSYVSSWFGSAY